MVEGNLTSSLFSNNLNILTISFLYSNEGSDNNSNAYWNTPMFSISSIILGEDWCKILCIRSVAFYMC